MFSLLFPCCADVVYDPEIISALINVLQKLPSSRTDGKPPEVFIASTIRNQDTFCLFQAELGRAFFMQCINSFGLFLYYFICGRDEQEYFLAMGVVP